MPLYILVPMIAIGLPVVIGLVYWTNRAKQIEALTQETVVSRFAQDFPAISSKEILISDNGKSALIMSIGDDQIGLVHTVGQNQLTRLLNSELIRQISETDKGIDLYVNDFTLKRIFLPFSDGAMRQKISNRLAFK